MQPVRGRRHSITHRPPVMEQFLIKLSLTQSLTLSLSLLSHACPAPPHSLHCAWLFAALSYTAPSASSATSRTCTCMYVCMYVRMHVHAYYTYIRTYTLRPPLVLTNPPIRPQSLPCNHMAKNKKYFSLHHEKGHPRPPPCNDLKNF